MSIQNQEMWPVACQPRGEKIGILGGTFNPPHVGHLFLADEAYRQFSLDKVLLLPVGLPPHKLTDPVLDREMRRQMGMLMAEERPYLELCTMELERDGYTYTIDTLRQLLKILPETVELYYIIGTDTLFELVTWREFEKVFPLTTFICVPRPGDDLKKVEACIERYKEAYGARVLLADCLAPDISSTAIRELIAAGGSAKGLVTQRVYEFMENNHAFRE
ncbi:MAG: nicotinate-nucleotide adenylyltransferase [Christensenellaceae bacterium]|nr:nicotinate-nucleotide adenylyltransferase [Christensenellaceae bacterium]